MQIHNSNIKTTVGDAIKADSYSDYPKENMSHNVYLNHCQDFEKNINAVIVVKISCHKRVPGIQKRITKTEALIAQCTHSISQVYLNSYMDPPQGNTPLC